MLAILEGDSVIPERENIIYHVVSMKWYSRWLSYVKLQDPAVNQNKKTVSEKEAGKHPGPINTLSDVEDLLDITNMNKMIIWK